MSTTILVACLMFGSADGPEAQKEKSVTVARVIIVGNATVSDTAIRKAVGIAPGDTVTAKTLRQAEKALARLGVFEADPEKGIRPTVTVVDPNQPGPRDILIQVKEASPKRK